MHRPQRVSERPAAMRSLPSTCPAYTKSAKCTAIHTKNAMHSGSVIAVDCIYSMFAFAANTRNATHAAAREALRRSVSRKTPAHAKTYANMEYTEPPIPDCHQLSGRMNGRIRRCGSGSHTVPKP